MTYKDPKTQREYQRKWIAKRRADWLCGRCCYDCGSTDRLEIDHVDPATKISHNVWSWSVVRQNEELAKCVVRCQPCHTAKTLRDRPKTDHGRAQMYQKFKCRCPKCRAWKYKERFDYEQRKKQRTGL